MISEERLKELIEQEATIYEVKYHNINPVKLTHETQIIGKIGYIKLKPIPNEKYLYRKYFKNLYETKDQAEWERDFKRIGRTEYLDLPSWEELQPKIKDLEVYHGYLIAFNSRFAMEYENGFIDQICLYQNQPPYESWNWNAGKENYIKACGIAKRLFLGEEEK